MRSILKALGLTIWGAIAILLSVIFIIVAFQVAMRYRASRNALELEKELNDQTSQSQPAQSAASIDLPERAPDLRTPEVVAPIPEAAAPRTEETDCARGTPHTTLDAPQRARLARLLDQTEAAKAESGNAFVRLGELYYGFGEYALAVASIKRGLEKGRVSHLDEAFVYLGRSEVGIGDIEAAQAAFGKLKDVPGISPRVLRLWTLYAEMLSRTSNSAAVTAAECRKSEQ